MATTTLTGHPLTFDLECTLIPMCMNMSPRVCSMFMHRTEGDIRWVLNSTTHTHRTLGINSTTVRATRVVISHHKVQRSKTVDKEIRYSMCTRARRVQTVRLLTR